MNQYQGSQLLLEALANPGSMASLTLPEWQTLIGAARQTRLLARLHCLLQRTHCSEQPPEEALRQLASAATIVRYHQRRALWELNRIKRVLGPAGIPIVLLKGGAYLMMELELSCGREMRDVDLLIGRAQLQDAEKRLLEQGWGGVRLDDYDQQYYRRWMHELPPMRHKHRVTEVDIHHAVLPLTSRLHPDPDKILSQVQPLRSAGFGILAPADMVLHSAVHLFYDGAMDRDFRDLVDLDQLLRHFSNGADFWPGLVSRAETLQLGRPLFYALHFSQRLLATPVPTEAWQQCNAHAPALPIRVLMDQLVPRALLPSDPARRTPLIAFSRWLLYLRSHWLRMPPLMLARHLFHKGVISNMRHRRRLFE